MMFRAAEKGVRRYIYKLFRLTYIDPTRQTRRVTTVNTPSYDNKPAEL